MMAAAPAQGAHEGEAVFCAIAVLGIIAPRALAIIWWVNDPARWTATFSGAVVPTLGFLFLPWTTIMYMLFWTTTGLSGLGWLAVLLGIALDLGTYGGGVFGTSKHEESHYTGT
jgi:hypothetical protein